MNNMDLKQLLDSIPPADPAVRLKAEKHLDNLTKPLHSLGELELCAAKYAAARGTTDVKICRKSLLTFAGDHGVAAEGVSNVPQSVTIAMVRNMSQGGAGINVLARHADAELKIIEVGAAAPCDFPNVIHHHVADGTKNIAEGAAMTREEALRAFFAGVAEAVDSIDRGADLLGTGEMGIANTTPSAALYCAYLNLDPADVCGCGTGISDRALLRKVSVVRRALEVNREAVGQGAFETLTALGGLEIAAIAGMVAACAARRVPVVIDGYISGAAALAAIRMKPEILDYCFFSHLSGDKGHAVAMRAMGIKPLLDLGMRLGEGTGAALAFHLIEASVKLLSEMATFESAGFAP